jgi:hypothetical protein
MIYHIQRHSRVFLKTCSIVDGCRANEGRGGEQSAEAKCTAFVLGQNIRNPLAAPFGQNIGVLHWLRLVFFVRVQCFEAIALTAINGSPWDINGDCGQRLAAKASARRGRGSSSISSRDGLFAFNAQRAYNRTLSYRG